MNSIKIFFRFFFLALVLFLLYFQFKLDLTNLSTSGQEFKKNPCVQVSFIRRTKRNWVGLGISPEGFRTGVLPQATVINIMGNIY